MKLRSALQNRGRHQSFLIHFPFPLPFYKLTEHVKILVTSVISKKLQNSYRLKSEIYIQVSRENDWYPRELSVSSMKSPRLKQNTTPEVQQFSWDSNFVSAIFLLGADVIRVVERKNAVCLRLIKTSGSWLVSLVKINLFVFYRPFKWFSSSRLFNHIITFN